MAGEAKTNSFMLGTATVMLGPVADLMKFQPATHSIGLVKNFTLSSQPNYIELTQGVKNTIVDSQMNQNPVRATMEAYEFTAANLAYALGLDGSSVTPFAASSTVATQITGGSSTTSVVLATGGGASFGAGNTIAIELDTNDKVLIRKVVSKSTDTLTIDYDIPTGTTVQVGAVVRKVNVVDVGSKTNQPYLAATVIGVLGNGERVGIMLPKLRIVKGFNMAFTTNDYGNMPIEFTIYDLVSTDPFYAYFGNGDATAKLFRP
jgi:hypothetical protein